MTYRCFLWSPSVVFAARVNQATFEYPIAEVAYDTVTTGAFGNMNAGQTVLFGTSAGASDLGRQRIRKAADASKIYFGRSSRGIRDGEVSLQNDAYITVLNSRRVWAVAPNEEGFPTFKDEDVAVGNYMTNSPPKANIGADAHDAGFAATIDPDTNVITVALDGTNSFATASGATITDYLWNVNDGTITVGTTTSSQITATFPAGKRFITLKVTDSNGETHTQTYPIFARDPASDDTIASQITSRTRRKEGQEIDLRILEDIDRVTYPDGMLVMVWKDEPASASDRNHMQFVGWHQSDPSEIVAHPTGTLKDTTLHCVDAAGKLATLPGFPQEVGNNSDDFEGWSLVASGNSHMDWFLWYLLYWHSTVLDLVYWEWSGTTTDYGFVVIGSDGESLYDQVNRKCNSLVPDHHLACTRQGGLQVVVDPMLQDSGDRTATIQTTLDESKWKEIHYENKAAPSVHWLWSDAIVASTTDIAAIFCVAPGPAPGQGLSEQPHGEQLAQSQASLNACEGHRYARFNALLRDPLPSIVLADPAEGQNIDPADLTWVRVNVGSAYSARRGLSLSNERGLPVEVSHSYEYAREGVAETVEVVWEEETEGIPATTHVIEQDGNPGDDWEDDYDPPPDDPGLQPGQNNIVGPNSDGHLYKTSDFQTPSAAGGPTWSRVNLGLSGTIYGFSVDPFCPAYLGTGTDVNGWIVTSTNIYYIEDMFGSSPTVNDQHTFGTAITASGAARSIWAGFGNFNSNQAYVCVVSYYRNQAGHTGTWSIFSEDGGTTWGSEVQISSHYNTGTLGVRPPIHVSPRYDGKIYTAAFISTGNPSSADGYISIDKGASWSRISNPNIDPDEAPMQGINVPWQSNPDETLVYYGAITNTNDRFQTVRADGATRTIISPTDGTGAHYAPRLHHWSIVTFDPDPNYVACAGVAEADDVGTADDYNGLWVSDDRGDSWTEVEAPAANTGAVPWGAAFGGDSKNVLYAWGQNGYIKYGKDFGAALDDRRGNIPADFAGIGHFIGIAGGP